MQIGYKLATGAFGPAELIRQAVLAEQSGFDFADAGFDHLVAMNAGPDPDGFMDFFARELAEPLRALPPGGGGVRDQG
jgi:hypothetical protein